MADGMASPYNTFLDMSQKKTYKQAFVVVKEIVKA